MNSMLYPREFFRSVSIKGKLETRCRGVRSSQSMQIGGGQAAMESFLLFSEEAAQDQIHVPVYVHEVWCSRTCGHRLDSSGEFSGPILVLSGGSLRLRHQASFSFLINGFELSMIQLLYCPVGRPSNTCALRGLYAYGV